MELHILRLKLFEQGIRLWSVNIRIPTGPVVAGMIWLRPDFFANFLQHDADPISLNNGEVRILCGKNHVYCKPKTLNVEIECGVQALHDEEWHYTFQRGALLGGCHHVLPVRINGTKSAGCN